MAPNVGTLNDSICSVDGCGKPSTSQCPKCVGLGLPAAYFCSQTCFRTAWKEHKLVHEVAALLIQEEKEVENSSTTFTPPPFGYTGSIRPHYVTPMRMVPSSIRKPDYADTGVPSSELQRKGDMKIDIKTPEQIENMRKACRIGREILDVGARMVAVGVTTEEIDKAIHEATIARGAYPSPLNYHSFPKSCCTSPNEIICHGIPDARPLEDGDIVNIDVSCYIYGVHADLNETYLVGNVKPKYKKLVKVAHDSLQLAIQHAKPGVFFREFGSIISKFVQKQGFSVVKSYCGHGIGELFHSAPNIPHYARNKAVGVLKPGMTFTIEPMINEGNWKDVTWPDDWTSATIDGLRSAQFEHTLVVTEDGCEILTARTKDSPPLFWEDAAT